MACILSKSGYWQHAAVLGHVLGKDILWGRKTLGRQFVPERLEKCHLMRAHTPTSTLDPLCCSVSWSIASVAECG